MLSLAAIFVNISMSGYKYLFYYLNYVLLLLYLGNLFSYIFSQHHTLMIIFLDPTLRTRLSLLNTPNTRVVE